MTQDDHKQLYEDIKKRALKLLSVRAHTRRELLRKLKIRYPSSEIVIERILNRLEELKILDDKSFAEIFLDNLIRFKSFGYYSLLQKLQSRGIDNELAYRLVSEKVTPQAESSIASRFIGRNKTKDELHLKILLKRRGFRNQAISQIISDLRKNGKYGIIK